MNSLIFKKEERVPSWKEFTSPRKIEITKQYIELPEILKENYKKILLINPNWRKATYLDTNVKGATINHPVLTLPTLATPLLQEGHDVQIIDLDFYSDPDKNLLEKIKSYKPDIVGTTGTTPFFHEIIRISKLIKEYDKNIKIVVGGAHATAYPEEFVETSHIDYAIKGSGDYSIVEIAKYLNGEIKLEDIKSLVYMENGKIKKTKNRSAYELEDLPLPSWQLVPMGKYANSYVLSKKNPIGPIETSRGCPWACHYCTKTIFGTKFNAKSPKKVVDEMEFMLKMGFNEIHIQDDLFSTDTERVKGICDEIQKRGLKFPWMLMNGIRVDTVELEMLKKLKKAGCYMTGLGIESGNQEVLDDIGKGITLEQTRNAIRLLKKAKIETFGFFMLGLPKDNEKTMQQTIDFAKELNLDLVKFDICVPLPGTTLFRRWEKEGVIKTKDWKNYLFHQDASVLYDHPNVSWSTLTKYYKKAFREYYFRPNYVLKRLKRSIAYGNVMKDLKVLLTTKWT